jgi:hypothetical protein
MSKTILNSLLNNFKYDTNSDTFKVDKNKIIAEANKKKLLDKLEFTSISKATKVLKAWSTTCAKLGISDTESVESLDILNKYKENIDRFMSNKKLINERLRDAKKPPDIHRKT